MRAQKQKEYQKEDRLAECQVPHDPHRRREAAARFRLINLRLTDGPDRRNLPPGRNILVNCEAITGPNTVCPRCWMGMELHIFFFASAFLDGSSGCARNTISNEATCWLLSSALPETDNDWISAVGNRFSRSLTNMPIWSYVPESSMRVAYVWLLDFPL